jgi:uncharacterized protein with GYD domain
MSAYMLLCNFTEQGVRTIKEAPSGRPRSRLFLTTRPCGSRELFTR